MVRIIQSPNKTKLCLCMRPFRCPKHGFPDFQTQRKVWPFFMWPCPFGNKICLISLQISSCKLVVITSSSTVIPIKSLGYLTKTNGHSWSGFGVLISPLWQLAGYKLEKMFCFVQNELRTFLHNWKPLKPNSNWLLSFVDQPC